MILKHKNLLIKMENDNPKIRITTLLQIPKNDFVDDSMVAFHQTIEFELDSETICQIEESSHEKSNFYLELSSEDLQIKMKISGIILSFENNVLQIVSKMDSVEQEYIESLIEMGFCPNKQVIDLCEIRIPLRPDE